MNLNVQGLLQIEWRLPLCVLAHPISIIININLIFFIIILIIYIITIFLKVP